MSDAELVERARHGDSAAFGELVDRHRAAVYRAALAVLGSSGEAEDAAQEAFVTAYSKLGTFRGEAGFKTWLLAIAWREALDQRRSLLSRWRRLVATEAEEPAVAPGPSPEEAMLETEFAARVRRLVEALPMKLRSALLLSATGEHTYDEMAAVLDEPVGTVKWRVMEARRRLKEKLVRLGYERE